MNPATSAAAQRVDQFIANPRRALWSLSLPIMVGMSVQTAYLVADMIFVGMLSGEALTALAFNIPLVFLAMGSTFGLGSGVTALVAQAIGARDKKRADAVAEHAVVLALLVTVVLTVAGLLWGRPLLRLLGVPPELLAPAWEFFRILAAGYVFMVLAIFFRSILSGEGDVKLPVLIQMASTVLNVALDPIFIFTLGMGVAGAALATVVSQAAAAVAFFYLLFVRRRTYVEFDFRRFRFDPAIAGAIFRIGVPASLSFLVMAIGGGVFNRILVAYSPDAVAAHQIGGRLDHVVILPLVAMAGGLVTLVGMFYGAGRTDLVRGILRYSLACSAAIGTTIGVLFYLLAPQLVGVFTSSESIRDFGVLYVRIVVLAYPLFGVSMLTGRALQGLGRGTPELLLALLRVILIAGPLAAFFTFGLHKPVHWVWIAAVIASWVSAGIAAVWLRMAVSELEARFPEPADAVNALGDVAPF